MSKQNEALFEESSQGSVSAITLLIVVLSIVLAFGGMVVSSYAFEAESNGIWIFAGGLIATVIGFILPFTWLPATGK